MMNAELVRRALRGHQPVTDDAPGAAPAAVSLVLRETGSGLAGLFIRRAERFGDPWSGQVGLPGGRWEIHDRDLLTTAMRETREETGVALGTAAALAQLSDLRPRTPLLPSIYVRPFVFVIPERPALTLSSEVQEARWIGLEELLAPGVRRSVRIADPRLPGEVSAYVVREWTIWGMTERIVTSFLNLLSPGTA